MSKITCFVLFAVAISFGNVHVHAEEDVAIIIGECAKQYGVTPEEIQAAKQSKNADAINPCFTACFYKKTDIFNNKGELNVDTGAVNIKKYAKFDGDFEQLSEIVKKCSSVNEKPVNDGEAGCERGTLLTACLLEHKVYL